MSPILLMCPKTVSKNRTLHLVDTLDEVIELALLPPEERARDKNRQEQEDEADNDAEA
jgi:hypothetical protein